MAKLPENIRRIGEKFGLKSADMWDCHGTWVAYHRALERIAAEQKIAFQPPTVLEAEGPRVAICVFGSLGDQTEWSIGEAAPSNNKNAYPWAMAEKRAKDRVILKLLGLHGLVYSEEEADDFKPEKPEAVERNPPYPKMSQAAHKREGTFEEVVGEIMQCRAPDELRAWRAANTDRVRSLPKKWIDPINDAYAEHLETLKAMTDGVLNDVA